MSRVVFQHPVLDIGCGEELFAHLVFQELIGVGIDPNPEEPSRASQLGGYNKPENCFDHSVPSISESFETVISNSTLEHISNIDEAINEACRLLKKGGKLYVTLPTYNFDKYTAFYQLATLLKLNQLGYLYQDRFNKFWAHKHFMHPNRWVEKFEGLGFSCSQEINYGKKYQCILDEATVPFSLIAFILKKTLNPWSLSTKLKLIYGFPIYLFTGIDGSNFLTDRESAGLVFFEFTKK